MVSLGVVTILPYTRDIIEFAKATEAEGFERIGLADTAPRLYHAVYPAITGTLLATERLRVGNYISNFVSQHWSVHGSAAKSMEDLAPGRFFSGLATGDGAVHSVGLKPATLAQFEEAVTRLAQWIRDGRLRYSEDVLEGIEHAPGAIAGLYRGENTGKRLIRIR